MKGKRIFEENAVEATSVAAFLARYYKPDRYTGRGPSYAAGLLTSHEADFAKFGFDWISRHDSVTGCLVSYYAPKETTNEPQ